MTGRKARDTGYDVQEGSMQVSVTVVIAHIHIETRWECPQCRARWAKKGKHHGTQRTCRRCNHSFWLRPG